MCIALEVSEVLCFYSVFVSFWNRSEIIFYIKIFVQKIYLLLHLKKMYTGNWCRWWLTCCQGKSHACGRYLYWTGYWGRCWETCGILYTEIATAMFEHRFNSTYHQYFSQLFFYGCGRHNEKMKRRKARVTSSIFFF